MVFGQGDVTPPGTSYHNLELLLICPQAELPSSTYDVTGPPTHCAILGAYAPSFSVSAIILRALLVIHCLYLHCLYLTNYVIYRHLSQGWEYYCSGCDGHLIAGGGLLLSRLRQTGGDNSLFGGPTSTLSRYRKVEIQP